MNWKNILLIGILLTCTLVPILYKTLVVGLDFFPKLKKDIWEVEFIVDLPRTNLNPDFRFPSPQANDRIRLVDFHFTGKNISYETEQNPQGQAIRIILPQKGIKKIHYRAYLQSLKKKYSLAKKDKSKRYEKEIEYFSSLISTTPEIEKLLTRLENELLPKKTDKVKILKSLFYFVQEEILHGDHTVGLETTLLHSRGSALDQAQLLTLLLRRQKIPVRLVHGIQLLENKNLKRPWVHWVEAYLGQQWIPMFPAQGYFAEIPARFVPLYKSIQFENPYAQSWVKPEIYARRVLSDQFNALQYRHQLEQQNFSFLNFSPYVLPLADQVPLKILLLFSVGCIVLAVCRNIIGIKTFGIFFPILLALFFKQTSFLFGLGFFLFIILVGYAERKLLRNLHLLAVPRFSIILTFLIMTLLGFAILNHHYQFSNHNPTILPIIIITMFIERFSVMLEEEGGLNTIKSLLGTLVIALLSYGVFSWKDLEILIYTHPELLFIVVAFLILIGKYTGYRINELIRFRTFLQNKSSHV